ncbi:MAG: glycosyltransferase family 9 protein [Deltaproteobacteria bacterium]|nr:glycosyltransferase family 9 protein [Deltaproteobacteria bacterium]
MPAFPAARGREFAKPLPARADKILIIHQGGIGDLLLALPALRLLRRTFHSSRMDFLGIPERLGLVAHDLGGGSVHTIHQPGLVCFYMDGEPLPPGLSAFFSSYDLAVVFAKAAGPLARNLKRAGLVGVLTLSPFPPEGSRIHAADYLLGQLGMETVPEGLYRPLALPAEAEDWAGGFRERSGLKDGRCLVMHPGSGSRAKNWPAQSFSRVADWAALRGEVLLISGPAGDQLEETLRGMKGRWPKIAVRLSLIHLAAVLKGCTAYIGNDSGITHLAALVGLPTVAVFGPTSPEAWAPRGPGVHILSSPAACRPCGAERRSQCPRSCLADLQPDRAISLLAPFLTDSK